MDFRLAPCEHVIPGAWVGNAAAYRRLLDQINRLGRIEEEDVD